jgi:hypothetical protein
MSISESQVNRPRRFWSDLFRIVGGPPEPDRPAGKQRIPLPERIRN